MHRIAAWNLLSRELFIIIMQFAFLKNISIRNLFRIICIICILIILCFRLQEGIKRGFGSDEYYHLHQAYLLSLGKIPYIDFYSIYSPFFALTLSPIFHALGESFDVLIYSRILVFFYCLLGLVITYGIGRLIADIDTALIMTVIASAMPSAIEKAIEIRPDNLMTTLLLCGIFFLLLGLKNGRNSNFFL